MSIIIQTSISFTAFASPFLAEIEALYVTMTVRRLIGWSLVGYNELQEVQKA